MQRGGRAERSDLRPFETWNTARAAGAGGFASSAIRNYRWLERPYEYRCLGWMKLYRVSLSLRKPIKLRCRYATVTTSRVACVY